MTERVREQIVLRRLGPADRPILRRWLRDPVVQAAIEDETIASSRMRKTVALFESSDPFRDGSMGLLVERAGKPIGLIHFVWINWISRNAEVVIFVGPGELRNSLTAMALIVNVGHAAFRDLNLNKFYAFVYGSNTKALSVFKRLCAEEACLRSYVKSQNGYEDVHFFGFLASEYAAGLKRLKGRF